MVIGGSHCCSSDDNDDGCSDSSTSFKVKSNKIGLFSSYLKIHCYFSLSFQAIEFIVLLIMVSFPPKKMMKN